MESINTSAVQATAATINKATIAKYALLSAPGKFEIEASGSNNKYVNPRLAKNPRYSHSILVNLRAVEARKIPALIEAFGTKDAVELDAVRNLTFVHEIIVNVGQSEPELPAKGEKVVATLDWATDKATGEAYKDVNGKQVLNITSMRVPQAIKPASVFGNVDVRRGVESAQ